MRSERGKESIQAEQYFSNVPGSQRVHAPSPFSILRQRSASQPAPRSARRQSCLNDTATNMSASCFMLHASSFARAYVHPSIIPTLLYCIHCRTHSPARTHVVQASHQTWNLHVPIINIHNITFVVVIVIIIIVVVVIAVSSCPLHSSRLFLALHHRSCHCLSYSRKLPSRRWRFRGVGFWIFVAAHYTCGMLVSHRLQAGIQQDTGQAKTHRENTT